MNTLKYYDDSIIPNMPVLASGGANFDNLATWIKNGVDAVGFGGLLTKGTK